MAFGRRGIGDAQGRSGGSAAAPPQQRPAPQLAALPTVEPAGRLDRDSAVALLQPIVDDRINAAAALGRSRGDVAREIEAIVAGVLAERRLVIDSMHRRDTVTALINGLLEKGRRDAAATAGNAGGSDKSGSGIVVASRASVDDAVPRIYPLVMER